MIYRSKHIGREYRVSFHGLPNRPEASYYHAESRFGTEFKSRHLADLKHQIDEYHAPR